MEPPARSQRLLIHVFFRLSPGMGIKKKIVLNSKARPQNELSNENRRPKIFCYCSFYLYLCLRRYDVRSGRPVLAAYLERVKAQLNPHYDDVHSVGKVVLRNFLEQGKFPQPLLRRRLHFTGTHVRGLYRSLIVLKGKKAVFRTLKIFLLI
jgi:hypothetical protein